jgi:hypothetical protein
MGLRTFSQEYDTTCLESEIGDYSNENSSECMKCPAGTYSNKKNCFKSKMYRKIFSLEDTSVCQSFDEFYNFCSYKIYDINYEFKYNSNNNFEYTKCKKGYFVEKGRNRCTIGIFSKEGAEECTKCSARTYGNNNLGQSLYLKCSAGYF